MKPLYVIVLFFIVLYAAFLSFNHINAWIGLGIVFLDVILLFVYLNKQFNNQQK